MASEYAKGTKKNPKNMMLEKDAVHGSYVEW